MNVLPHSGWVPMKIPPQAPPDSVVLIIKLMVLMWIVTSLLCIAICLYFQKYLYAGSWILSVLIFACFWIQFKTVVMKLKRWSLRSTHEPL